MKLKCGNVVSWLEEPSCEHCGDLEPFEPTVQNDCSWCLCCFEANDGKVSNDEKEKISELTKQKKIEYFRKRLAQLES